MPQLTEEELSGPREPERKVELPPDRKEEERKRLGNVLFIALYNKKEDADNFLSFPEQDYFIKKSVALAYEHSDDPDVLMSKAHSYAVRNPEEIERIRTIISLGRKKFLPEEDRLMLDRYQKWLLLSDDEKKNINDKIAEVGAQYLDDPKKDLFLPYWNNKLRRAWFTGVVDVVKRLAHFNFFDENAGSKLLDRSNALYKAVTNQSMNTHENVIEGDALIREALEQLFSTIEGLEGEERKRELQKLLGIPEEEKTTDQCPRT